MRKIYALKRFVMSLLALMVSVGTFAKQAEVDGICYDLNSETKEATVIAKDDKSYKVVIIPSSVTFGSQTYSVTSIAPMAFFECSDLTSVTIPKSVTNFSSIIVSLFIIFKLLFTHYRNQTIAWVIASATSSFKARIS